MHYSLSLMGGTGRALNERLADLLVLYFVPHARIQKVLSEGVQLCQGFFRGRIQANTNKAGHHRLASEAPFKWRFTGRLIIAQI